MRPCPASSNRCDQDLLLEAEERQKGWRRTGEAESPQKKHHSQAECPTCPSQVPAWPVSVLLWGRNRPTTNLGLFCSTIVIIHIPGWRLNVLHMRRRFQWTGRVSEDVPRTPHLVTHQSPCVLGPRPRSRCSPVLPLKLDITDLSGIEDSWKDEKANVHVCPSESCYLTVVHLISAHHNM